MRRLLTVFFLLLLVGPGLTNVFAAEKPFAQKKLVLQISENDPEKETLVLNVANNLLKHYGPDQVAVEIVAYGPGLNLLLAENSNSPRIKSLADNGVALTACSNTIQSFTKKLGHAPKINEFAKTTTPGIVRIADLVSEGYILVTP